jgi:hypothetical protein
LNRHWHRRRGAVFAERYFARALAKPMQVWRALRYVLNNARKHGAWFAKHLPDPFSSGRWFNGWEGQPAIQRPLRGPPLARPRHYLTISGEHWPIALDEIPGRPTPGRHFDEWADLCAEWYSRTDRAEH